MASSVWQLPNSLHGLGGEAGARFPQWEQTSHSWHCWEKHTSYIGDNAVSNVRSLASAAELIATEANNNASERLAFMIAPPMVSERPGG